LKSDSEIEIRLLQFKTGNVEISYIYPDRDEMSIAKMEVKTLSIFKTIIE